MNHYVYLITNNINGKKYIGKRACRCSIEEDSYMGSGTLLRKAQKKYGIENFSKEILVICKTEEQAFEEEKKAIELVNAWSNPQYYNLVGGGRGCGSGESSLLSKECIIIFEDKIYKTPTRADMINLFDRKFNIKISHWFDRNSNNFMGPLYRVSLISLGGEVLFNEEIKKKRTIKYLCTSAIKEKDNNLVTIVYDDTSLSTNNIIPINSTLEKEIIKFFIELKEDRNITEFYDFDKFNTFIYKGIDLLEEFQNNFTYIRDKNKDRLHLVIIDNKIIYQSNNN